MTPALLAGDRVRVEASRHPRDGAIGTVKSVKRLPGDTLVTVEFGDSGADYTGLGRKLHRVAPA